MKEKEIIQRIDDIVYGLWGGVKFKNERFEQEPRVMNTPEPLDPHEQKALFIELLNDLGVKL